MEHRKAEAGFSPGTSKAGGPAGPGNAGWGQAPAGGGTFHVAMPTEAMTPTQLARRPRSETQLGGTQSIRPEEVDGPVVPAGSPVESEKGDARQGQHGQRGISWRGALFRYRSWPSLRRVEFRFFIARRAKVELRAWLEALLN